MDYLESIFKSKIEVKQLFNIMNVYQAHLFKDPRCIDYTLHIRNIRFNTLYENHIPIDITDCEFKQITSCKYLNKKETPILYKIRNQAIDYLKKTNAFKK